MPHTALLMQATERAIQVVRDLPNVYTLIKHQVGGLFSYELVMFTKNAELDDLAELIPAGASMSTPEKVSVDGEPCIIFKWFHIS